MGKIYRYGMRLRGFSIGCQPMDGYESREDDPTGKYHDILAYKRPLTQMEMDEYELDYLGEPENDILKPCPFCGGKPERNKIDRSELTNKNGWDTYWISCEDCGAETSGCESEEQAAYAWNRRKLEPKKGKWEYSWDSASEKICSVCGVDFHIVKANEWKYDYCPSCGAYMREDANERNKEK